MATLDVDKTFNIQQLERHVERMGQLQIAAGSDFCDQYATGKDNTPYTERLAQDEQVAS